MSAVIAERAAHRASEAAANLAEAIAEGRYDEAERLISEAQWHLNRSTEKLQEARRDR